MGKQLLSAYSFSVFCRLSGSSAAFQSLYILLPVPFSHFSFFPPLTNCLHTYLLLKRSKSTLAKSTPRSGGQQFCSCSLNLGSDLRSFWRPLFIELDGSGDFIFLRRVWPVSSARFSSTEQDDQRQTWTCQRLCRTPLVRGDAGRREETEQFRDGRSVITTRL